LDGDEALDTDQEGNVLAMLAKLTKTVSELRKELTRYKDTNLQLTNALDDLSDRHEETCLQLQEIASSIGRVEEEFVNHQSPRNSRSRSPRKTTNNDRNQTENAEQNPPSHIQRSQSSDSCPETSSTEDEPPTSLKTAAKKRKRRNKRKPRGTPAAQNTSDLSTYFIGNAHPKCTPEHVVAYATKNGLTIQKNHVSVNSSSARSRSFRVEVPKNVEQKFKSVSWPDNVYVKPFRTSAATRGGPEQQNQLCGGLRSNDQQRGGTHPTGGRGRS
jgi:hypothetical protein